MYRAGFWGKRWVVQCVFLRQPEEGSPDKRGEDAKKRPEPVDGGGELACMHSDVIIHITQSRFEEEVALLLS